MVMTWRGGIGLALVTVIVLLAACAPAPEQPAETSWWPGASLKDEPAQLLEIPSLDDQEFMAEVRRVVVDVESRPTDRSNYRERVDLARRFYSALEADGVLVPRIGLLALNLVEARSTDPDPLFLSYCGGIDATLRGGMFLLANRDRLGRVEVVRPTSLDLEARSYATIELTYTVGEIPLEVGAKIRFSGDWFNDMSPLQFSRPQVPGFVTVRSSNPDVRLVTGLDYWNAVWGSLYPPGLARPTVTVAEGSLQEGDTLTIVIGDTGQGSPGFLVRSTAIDVMPIRLELSLDGGDMAYVPIGEPHFSVHGGPAHHLRVVAPTTIHRGRSFTVRAAVEDLYANRATNPPPSLILLDGEREIARAGHAEGDPAIFHFQGITWPEGREGALVLTARDEAGTLFGSSNPTVVVADDEPLVCWGQVHGHEGYTDGSGTAEWYMRYARDVGFLDFASLSSHDIMISELHLRDVARATVKYNQPHAFVTLKGYEWTQDTRFGGHHNVYYRSTEQRNIPAYEAPTISDLYRAERAANDPGDVLIIPHCHQPGDWNFNDAAMERLVEIYSTHGSFEWFGRRYLEQGYHVGLMTAADDHTGHPGNNMGLAANRFGQTAVFAPELTRDGIFDALRARRCYGATVARIYLDARTAGAPMGSEVAIARPNPPSIHVEGVVAGTAPIARVVAVVNGQDGETIDYLDGDTSNAARLRVMVGSSSEPTDRSRVLPPLSSEYRLGRIAVPGARVRTITPLGLEGPGDSFVQTGADRVDFFCTTRGDEDGVLVELDRWPEHGVVNVELYAAPFIDPSARTIVTIRNALWGEERMLPRRDLIQRFQFPLAAVAEGAQQQPFAERSFVRVERVSQELEPYRRFAFDVTRDLKANDSNYVYLRVEQIDDERAWSSPVWVTWAD